MATDTERMDFLETLRNRTIFVNKKNPAYYKRTDIHISGPDHCAIFARTEIGCEFHSHVEWRNFDEKAWLRMGGKKALNMKHQQFYALIALCDKHRHNENTESR